MTLQQKSVPICILETHPRHRRSCWQWSGLCQCWSRRSGLCEQATSSPRSCFQCACRPGWADLGWWRTGSRYLGSTSWSYTWRPLCNLHTLQKRYYSHIHFASPSGRQKDMGETKMLLFVQRTIGKLSYVQDNLQSKMQNKHFSMMYCLETTSQGRFSQ